jgi:hypothetical protein
MKKLLIAFLLFSIFAAQVLASTSDVARSPGSGGSTAASISTNTSAFNGTLTAADDTVQKALDTLDDAIAGAGTGDVTSVGDCVSGACNDGTSDGGTYIRLYDGDSHYGQFATANLSANRAYTFPNYDATMASLDGTETLTNKTISASNNVVDADTGDSATAFFSAGQIEAARGGTGIDTSGSSGLPRVAAGTWSVGAAEAYTDAGWNGDLVGATRDEVRDKIETMPQTAGRSLTLSTTTIDADAELYTDTKCVWWENPVAGDDFKSVWVNRTGNGVTVTDLWAESDQTVNMMFQVDDGTPADMDSVDLAATSTPATDTSLNGDATIANGDRVDIDVTSVSGTPTWVSACFTYTKDD